MAEVVLRNVTKRFDNVEAVRSINLHIEDNEFVVLVGPSGCGKSTTLRMVAGLEEVTSGDILIGGDVVNDLPPKDRDIAMVFQNYALYPHMSVFENMSFGLKLRRFPKDEIKKRVDHAARILDITELLDRKPRALSGGQRQSVAIARAILFNARILIMDEPTAALGPQETAQVGELVKQLKADGIGIFLISHDIHDVFDLADRICAMKNGRVVGTARVRDVTKDEVLGMIILGKCPPGLIPGPGAMAADFQSAF